jgi:hypothetical protein
VYSRPDQDAIKYRLDGAMSRENWLPSIEVPEKPVVTSRPANTGRVVPSRYGPRVCLG